MVNALRSCVALGAVLAAAAPALAADVRDVVRLPGGDLWIALSETPGGLTTEAGAGRLTVSVEGWRAAPRRIEPYGDARFAQIQVTETGFVLSGPVAGAAAERREGGVLIQLDGFRASAATDASDGADRGAASPPADSDRGQADTPAAPPAVNGPGAGSDRAEASPAGPAAEPAAPASQASAPACDAQAAALADAPWNLDLIVAQADCLVQAGEPANAAGLYERVLAFQPEHFQAALGLARLRQQAGRHAEAASLFETAAGSALTDGQALAAQAAARRAREESN